MIILTKPFFFLIMLLMLVFAFYLEMKDSALFSMLLLHRCYKDVTKRCYKDVTKMLCRVSCKALNRNAEPSEVRLSALRKGGKICLA